MCENKDPAPLHCYSAAFLSAALRLLSSHDELAKEVKNGASPLGRFISLSGMASSQPKWTGWTKERLRSSLYQARRIPVRRNDLTERFLDKRDDPHYEKNDLGRWEELLETTEVIWAQHSAVGNTQFRDGQTQCDV